MARLVTQTRMIRGRLVSNVYEQSTTSVAHTRPPTLLESNFDACYLFLWRWVRWRVCALALPFVMNHTDRGAHVHSSCARLF